MCDFQIDYRFFNSKSSTIKTEKKNMKMKCDFKSNEEIHKKDYHLIDDLWFSYKILKIPNVC